MKRNFNLNELTQKLKDDQSSGINASKLYTMYVILFSRSFAYLTIKDRIPQILTKAIDTLHRHKNEMFEKHGEV